MKWSLSPFFVNNLVKLGQKGGRVVTIRACIQTTWQLQSLSAMYLASVEESAIVCWALNIHEIAPPANLRKYPDCDF